MTRDIGSSLGRLVTGEGRDQISSPVGIVQGSSDAAKEGTENFLFVLGLISLSIALLNLLPLLPLDGGHIVFAIAEGIRGRAVDGDLRTGVHGRDRPRAAAVRHRAVERHRPTLLDGEPAYANASASVTASSRRRRYSAREPRPRRVARGGASATGRRAGAGGRRRQPPAGGRIRRRPPSRRRCARGTSTRPRRARRSTRRRARLRAPRRPTPQRMGPAELVQPAVRRDDRGIDPTRRLPRPCAAHDDVGEGRVEPDLVPPRRALEGA